jgi:uncharacterized protein
VAKTSTFKKVTVGVILFILVAFVFATYGTFLIHRLHPDVTPSGEKVSENVAPGGQKGGVPDVGPGAAKTGEVETGNVGTSEVATAIESALEKSIREINLQLIAADENVTDEIFFVMPVDPAIAKSLDSVAIMILLGAKLEALAHPVYNPDYVRLDYPLGDVRASEGVCTDVVVRAMRHANIDLQERVHEDMKKNFGFYPGKWGLRSPDSNIDHRRVPNLVKYFSRFGETLTTDSTKLVEWEPGDVVFWKFENGLDHCGMISDRKTIFGRPYCIHNCWRAVEEDCLEEWAITGHFRYRKAR